MTSKNWRANLATLAVVAGLNTFFAVGCSDAENPPANGGQEEIETDGGEPEPERACVAGDTQLCWCVVGSELTKGAQKCEYDGMSWTQCVCPEPEQEIPVLICEPGLTLACACVGGASGAQSCAQDGMVWDTCECPAAPSEEVGVDVTCLDNEDCPEILCQDRTGCVVNSFGPQGGRCQYAPKRCPLGHHCDISAEGTDWCSPYCRDSRDCPTGWECRNAFTWQAACAPPCDHPADEVCDGMDNDCDGTIDEDFGIGQSCWGSFGGPCAAEGVIECYKGEALCSTDPGGSDDRSRPEVCNGRDDDCDGEFDEDIDCPPQAPRQVRVTSALGTAGAIDPVLSFDAISDGGDALFVSLDLMVIPFEAADLVGDDHYQLSDGTNFVENYRFPGYVLVEGQQQRFDVLLNPPEDWPEEQEVMFQVCVSEFNAMNMITGENIQVVINNAEGPLCGRVVTLN